MHLYGSGTGIGGWIVASAVIALLWTVAACLVVGTFRHLLDAQHHHGHLVDTGVTVGRRAAEQALAERFGRGEIDGDEYRRRLSALQDTER